LKAMQIVPPELMRGNIIRNLGKPLMENDNPLYAEFWADFSRPISWTNEELAAMDAKFFAIVAEDVAAQKLKTPSTDPAADQSS
jgi:hypothetical protein